ncbi:MAG: PLP-dependent aminotransferase family protein [Gammaproteobacteria bacterium]|nr:PLP-dependent aminotransferase family protein [Gammaproteobacteria bacterium]MDH3409490.1 PLP-dependent aminotransferase family protein [Gammaproteobacteria bacterium]
MINFALNLPSAADSAAVLARTLETLTGSPSLSSFLDYQADGDLTRHLEAGATWIRRTGLRASSDALVLTNGAQHGLLVALLSLMRPGDVLLTEAATYAPVMALAAHFGLKLFPVPIDEKGLLPDALDSACRKTAATTLYCLPTLHTPTTSTMTVERREEIADVARKFGLCIIEDDVFGFLPQNRPPPVAHYAPERTIYVSSVSKSLAPGLRVGYLHAPKKMIRQLHSAVNLSCWMPPPLMAEIASIWIEDGTAEFLNDRRRVEAMFRQQTARRILGRHAFQADPCGMHLWLHLPAHWRPELFRISAEKRGVKLMTADVFSVAPSRAANAVRLCLSHEVSRERVVRGLDIVANLLDEQGDASALIV